MKKVTLILFTLLFALGSYLSTQTLAGDRACERRCRDFHRDALRLCNDLHGEARERCIREANERLRNCLQNCR
ncbi:MAG: hypothetical protein HY231_25955 [Acidobacteria bacterium]|nr:hypothetical protein [Acidobacteriota bacterium]